MIDVNINFDWLNVETANSPKQFFYGLRSFLIAIKKNH